MILARSLSARFGFFWVAMLVVSLSVAGCGDSNTDNNADTTEADTSEADVEDTNVEIPVLEPKILTECKECKEDVVGNVPLEVTFTLDLGDNDAEDYLISWDFGDGDKIKPSADTTSAELLKVAHTFKYKGLFPTRATVTWRKNLKVSKTVTQEVEVLQPSDIYLSPVALLSETTVFPKDTVKLQFDILNDGEGVKEAIKTCIYLSSDDKLDDKDLLSGTLEHPEGIASGLTGTSKISYTKDKPAEFTIPETIGDGNWFILVKADCEDVAPELNKQDNVGFATSLIQIDTTVLEPADLVVTEPQFDNEDTYSPGDTATYQLKLKNEGAGEAKNFEFGVFLSKDKKLNYDPKGIPPGTNLEDYVNKDNKDVQLTDPANSKVKSLAPGASLPVFRGFAMPEVPDGTYYLIAKIDTDEEVSEPNEDNNLVVSGKTLSVKKVIKKGVNLNLVDMTVKPKGTYLGGTVTVNWHVKNDGTEPTPEFPATVFFCPTPSLSSTTCIINKTNTTIPKMAVGEEKKGNVSVKINAQTPVADWYIYFQLDPENKIKELSEGDNTKVWKDPPLKVTATANVQIKPLNVGFHPSKVNAGDVLKISWKVVNSGSTGSGQSNTWIVMSPNNNISWSNLSQLTTVAKVVEPGVEGLEEGYRSATFVVPEGLSHKVSKYYVGVVLDPENKEAKDNHNDNAIAATKQVEVVGTKGGCYQDAFDLKINNDSKGNAKPMQPGTYKELAICESDEDWFLVDLPKGHSVFVTVVSNEILWTSPVPSDLNIDIYDPDMKPLDSVKGLGALKQAAALTVAKAGKHRIRVYPANTSVRATYELKIEVKAPPAGTDLYGNSMTVGPNATFPGGLVKSKLQLTNVGATQSGKFTIRYVLSSDATIDDKDTKLKEVTLDKGVGGATSQTLVDNLLLPVVKGGKYYVGAIIDSGAEVTESDEGNNNVTSNPIQLNSKITCATDNFTGNHTFADAASIGPETKTYSGLNVCPGLADWFTISLPKGKSLKAKINWKLKKDAGLIGIQIIDSSGTGILAGSANPLKTEAVLPYLQIGGTFYIHTYVLPIGNKPPEPYDYSLDVTVSEPDASDVCDADVYESNNSAATAASLGCGLASMSLCLGDEDWFFLNLEKGEKISVKFTHPGGGFNLNLYDNPKLAPLQSLSGSGTINFTAPAQGKYYVQAVYKTPGKKPTGSFNYQLFVDGGAGVDLVPSIKSLFPTKVEQGEDAYLTMNVANACKDNAGDFHYAYFFSEDNKLDGKDVKMKESKLTGGLAGKKDKDLDDKVQIPLSAKPGPAYVILKVDSKDEVKESQELNNSANAALTVTKICLADALEPNNAPTVASSLYTGTTTDLSICPYETDWFSFDAAKGETITATIAFEHKNGDLDLRLYEVGKFSAPVAASATKQSPEQIVFVAPKTTKYFLRVKGFTDNSNSYTLSFCKSSKGACFDCTDNIHCSGAGAFCNAGTCKKLGCTVGDDKTCDDANFCTSDKCVANKGCENNPVTAGVMCEDGDKCSAGEACDKSGACKAATGETEFDWAWNSVGYGGQQIEMEDGMLYLGSTSDGKGNLKGHLELHDGLDTLWSLDAQVTGFAVTHLAAAVSRTDMPQIVAVGWAKTQALTAPSGATLTVETLRAGPAAVNPSETVAALARVNNKTGKLVTVSTVGTAGSALLDVIQGPGGTVVAAGRTANGASGQDGWVVMFDSLGTEKWSVKLGGSGDDVFTKLVTVPQEGWYAVGVDNDGAMTKGLVAFIDLGGKVLWSQSYSPAKGGASATPMGWLAGATMLDAATLVVVGASDKGLGKGLAGWIAWLDVSGKNKAATVKSDSVIPAVTAQDAGFTGTTHAWFERVQKLADGSLLLAGSTGSLAGAKGGIDGGVWLMSGAKKVVKQLVWGGDAHEVGQSGLYVNGALHGFGTVAPHTIDKAAWSSGLQTPTKPDCNDFNPCTTDSCEAKTGCSNKPVKDGTSCGAGQTCNAGVCQ